MVEADTHFVWDQFNTEGPKGPAHCSRGRSTIGLDSWRVTTTHVQSFVLKSMLRGQPQTPPIGDDLAQLNYHLKSGHALHCFFCVVDSHFENIREKRENKAHRKVSHSTVYKISSISLCLF